MKTQDYGWGEGQRGAFLILAAVFMLIVLAFMGTVFLTTFTTSTSTAVNELQSGQALSIAEGGMERAVYRLKNGTSCNPAYPANLDETNVLLGRGAFDIVGTNHTLSTTLSAGIDNAVTIIPVASIATIAPAGRIRIESEDINYSGTSSVAAVCAPFAPPCLTGAVRAAEGTAAAAHAINTPAAQDQCRIMSTGYPLASSVQRAVERNLQNTGAMIVYAKGTGNNIPYFRRWDGTQWGPERSATALAVGVTINYIVLKFARTRNEAILGTLDTSGDIRVQVWDGNTNSWSATTLVSNIAGNNIYRGFDIEYETSGDRAILVYNSGNDTNPAYRIWDGSSWSGATSIAVPATVAAPAFQASSAVASSTGADVTVILPAHQANDILLLEVVVRDVNDTIAWPAGWTQIATVDRGTTARYWWAWKRATSSAETNPLVDKNTANGNTYAGVITYRGAITAGDPWEVQGAPQIQDDVDPGNFPMVLSGITTLSDQSLVVAAVAGEDNNNASITTTGTNPATYTEHYVDSGIGADGVITFSEAARTTAGATGDVSIAWSNDTPRGCGGILLALKPSAPPVWIELAPNPQADSSEIVMMKLDSNIDVYGMRWPGGGAAGTAWSNMGVGLIWDASAAYSGLPFVRPSKVIDVAYEQLSGRAIFIWGDATATDNYYRIWDGAALSAANILLDIPNMGNDADWVRLVPRPNSNQLMYGVQDGARDLNTARWSGAGWIVDGVEHDGTTEDVDSRNFDIVFETHPLNAGDAWLVWGNGGSVSRKQWDGAAWLAVLPPIGSTTALMQLAAHPVTGTLFAGIYENTNQDISEIHQVNGVQAWSAYVDMWTGPTAADPVMEKVSLAVERYMPNILWYEVVR